MPLTDATNRDYPTKSSSLSTWEENDDVLQQRRSTNTNVKVPAKQQPSKGKLMNTKNTGGRTTVKLTDVFPSKTSVAEAEEEEEEDFFTSSGKDEAVIVAKKGTYSLRHHHQKN
jgi:hypothetical protein